MLLRLKIRLQTRIIKQTLNLDLASQLSGCLALFLQISIFLSVNTNITNSFKTATHFFSKFILTTFLFVFTLNSQASTIDQNNLANHNSPYLAMHGQDPVHWQHWHADILKQAQVQNKLIFISSGYFSCHWCHVMQHENYQNTQAAQILNKHFISVKIDRELNPELDKTLIEFAQKTTGHAGWPQHVILTPTGYPFAAFIYLPNQAFNQRLNKIQSLWHTQSRQIENLAKQAAEQANTPINKTQSNSKPHLSQQAFIKKLFEQVNLTKDDLAGGLTGTSKFPKAPLLNSLLMIQELPEEIEEWLILTLEQMQSEHLFDHIHGGFYRYTVDPNWQTPHFEKMAYTNALLAQTYLMAGERWNRPDFLDTAKHTLTYLQNHLYSNQTKMYLGSQSALDKKGLEGGNYLWSKSQLQKALSNEEYLATYQAWSLDKSPLYELGWHPKPFTPNRLWKGVQIKLTSKDKAIPTDSKSILAWNGLVLSALSQAYLVLKDEHYLQSAQTLATTLANLIELENPPRALSENGSFMGRANLQDYALIKRGLEDYQAWSNDKQFNKTIEMINSALKNDFLSEQGWLYDVNPILTQQTGEWLMADNPMPSLTAILYCLQPKTPVQSQAALIENPLMYASYINSFDCMKQTTNPVK